MQTSAAFPGNLDEFWKQLAKPRLPTSHAQAEHEQSRNFCSLLEADGRVVELRGIEPLTSAVRLQRSPI